MRREFVLVDADATRVLKSSHPTPENLSLRSNKKMKESFLMILHREAKSPSESRGYDMNFY